MGPFFLKKSPFVWGDGGKSAADIFGENKKGWIKDLGRGGPLRWGSFLFPPPQKGGFVFLGFGGLGKPIPLPVRKCGRARFPGGRCFWGKKSPPEGSKSINPPRIWATQKFSPRGVKFFKKFCSTTKKRNGLAFWGGGPWGGAGPQNHRVFGFKKGGFGGFTLVLKIL